MRLNNGMKKGILKNIFITIMLTLICAFCATTFAYWNYSKTETQELTQLSAGDEVKANNYTSDIPVCYLSRNTSVFYTSIEKALSIAESGEIVYVIPPKLANYNNSTNAVAPDSVTYTIRYNCTIKSGVTLFIPTDNDSVSKVTSTSTLNSYITSLKQSTRDQGTTGYNLFATSNQARFLRITIDVAPNVTIVNNGTLLISGYLSGGTNSQGVVGHTSHSYSRILLGTNSKIIQNSSNANIYCFGYISEKEANNNSELIIDSGNLYLPCIINDYRGFPYSYAMTIDAIDTHRCSAFNELEFRNIDVLTSIKYNATVYGVMNIYVNYETKLMSVDETMHLEKVVIGSSSGSLIQLTDSTYSSVSHKYNVNDNTFLVKFYGGFTFNYLDITLSLKGQSVNLSTKNAYFPLSYKCNIELLCATNQTSATFNVTNQRFKLMTGARLYVGDNCTLKGSELIVYTAFYDGAIGKGQNIGNIGRQTYPLKKGGITEVSSTGKISMSSCAGTIFCDNSSNISASTTNIISKEPWSTTTSGQTTVPWTIDDYLLIKEELKIVSTSYLTKKVLYAGLNPFYSLSSFSPSYNISVNSSTSYSIETYQKTIFEDSISTFSIVPRKDIFAIYQSNKKYDLNSAVSYNENSPYLTGTSSSYSISANNGGINEFEVQSISIEGDTHDVPVDTVLQLTGTINDINKSYYKNYTWRSEDTSIATVDQTGLVKGIALGSTNIVLSCGGVSQTYLINVIDAVDVVGVSSVTITCSGKSSGDTFKDNGSPYTFKANIIGEDSSTLSLSDVSKVVWTFRNESSIPGDRVYFGIDSNNKLTTVSDTLSVQVTLAGGAAANSSLGSADVVNVVCTVTDIKGNVKSGEFKIVNDNAGGCFAKDTKILMSNGEEKEIQFINKGDSILTWNFFKSQYEEQKVAFIIDHGAKQYENLKLSFSNGESITIIEDHGIFDYDLNKYVYITIDNYSDYIGHNFVSYLNSNEYCLTKLVSGEVYLETTNAYSITTEYNYNAIANKLFTARPPDNLYNWIEMFGKLQYDVEKFNRDVETYGLYDYSAFEPYGISYYTFETFNGAYLRIPVEKGIFTFEYVIEQFNLYKEWIN